jgi:hypothetical protein
MLGLCGAQASTVAREGNDRSWRIISVEPSPASPPKAAFVLLSQAHVMIPAIPTGDARMASRASANSLIHHGLEDGGEKEDMRRPRGLLGRTAARSHWGSG